MEGLQAEAKGVRFHSKSEAQPSTPAQPFKKVNQGLGALPRLTLRVGMTSLVMIGAIAIQAVHSMMEREIYNPLHQGQKKSAHGEPP